MSGYGEWEVRLQACNDDGCVPEASQPADVAPTVRLSLKPPGSAQTRSGSGTRSLAGSSDPIEDAASYTVGWRRDGANPHTQAPAQPDAGAGPSGGVGPGANGQADTTPPRLERGEIDGDTMTFHFSEPLDEDAVGSQFRVTLGWGNGWCSFTAHPSRVEVSGNQVVVYGLSYGGWPKYERAQRGQHVQAYYYKDDRVVPAGERLRDRVGNEVATPRRSPGGHFPATRTIWLANLTAPPALERATAHPRWLTLTFNKRLDRNSVPAGSAFTVKVNDSAVSLASDEPVAVAGDTVTLVLAGPVASTDVVTVGYTKPYVQPLRGADGEARSFSNQSVTNRVGAEPSVSQVAITSNPADGEAYAPGETVRVALTFTEAVNVDTTGGTPRLKIKLAPELTGRSGQNYAGGSGTATLEFAYTSSGAGPLHPGRGGAPGRAAPQRRRDPVGGHGYGRPPVVRGPGPRPGPHGGLAPGGPWGALGHRRGHHIGPGRRHLRPRRYHPGDGDLQRGGGRGHHERHAVPQDQDGSAPMVDGYGR